MVGTRARQLLDGVRSRCDAERHRAVRPRARDVERRVSDDDHIASDDAGGRGTGDGDGHEIAPIDVMIAKCADPELLPQIEMPELDGRALLEIARQQADSKTRVPLRALDG